MNRLAVLVVEDEAEVRDALVLADHRMPGTSGVELLVELARDEAGLDHYVAKPWTPEGLAEVVREQLTDYVLDQVDDVLPYVEVLDGPRLLAAARDRLSDR